MRLDDPHAPRLGGQPIPPFFALDARGIPAFTVSADSAVIGDAGSTYRDGVISVVNGAAQALGARPGLRAREVIDAWARSG